MGTTPAERTEEYYQKVAAEPIGQIERGTAPWTQAWTPGEARHRLPANVKTGKAYRGGNSIWLASVAGRNGYSDHRWGTYRQVQDLGGQVRLALGHDPSRHAAYVGHWIKALRDDPREIYRAAQDAQEISDYVLDRARERDPEREGGRKPQQRHERGLEGTREAGRRAAAPPPLPEPGPSEQYRLFQRAWSGPGR